MKYYRWQSYAKYVALAGVFLFSACSKTPEDPYKRFRSKSADQIFAKGEQALSKKHYAEAARQFEALDGVYPFAAHAEQGQLDIIYAYYMDNDIPATILAADRYIRLYPRAEHVDYAYYMRGIVGLKQGLSWLQQALSIDPSSRDLSGLKEAFSAFQSLTEQYPRSRYTPDALIRMAYIRNIFAASELHVAQNYMEREAYVAAANRASYIVEHYQGSTSVPEALAIMSKAYHRLGMRAMAEATDKIIHSQ